ncbi:M3 family metallopeptidase [Shewanella psychropiezotolerans]|uniref:M3 family metallopeptidase n=1 Tax=Shewanella psychropiezotolerans TaxID=2593655 RepID=A0ABX5X447_9GAMM|nr:MULTISPECIES: M3 family metallopeptidase [Shewanella]MPY21711.1 M3 family metallopeptidase [Shewanella sp. YLB-07]QDO84703.1 M3 family metallopeptidase [Shewanella psychropiezotolerans]
MRKNLITIAMSMVFVLGGCSTQSDDTPQTQAKANMITQQNADKVLLHPSPLQDQAPQFDKIVSDDYLPAFRLGMTQHETDISKIINNPASASFDNTISAMETSGALLSRVSRMFFNLSGLISDDEMLKIQDTILPELTAHEDNIYLNRDLFARIETIYQHKDALKGEQKRLTELYYNNFLRAGAKLSQKDQAKIRDLNTSLAKAGADFSQNVLKSFKNEVILVTDKSQLLGLSADEIATLAAAAKSTGTEGYMITLVNTTRQPILAKLNNRELRQKIWQASTNRVMDTNGPLAIKLAQLRADKAALLGYPNWAAYTLADQMAKTPDAVFAILDDLVPKAIAKTRAEAEDIREEMTREGANFELQPWDWAFYAEKVRQQKYSLDENQIKPYFEFNRVLKDGLFYAMNRLYGIEIKPRTDLPVWQEDVMAFEVFNQDGSSIGIFYLDPYARPGKNGGAWMDEFVTQSGLLGTHPVVYNALNIPKPAAGKPTLMTFDEVTTMFHEFGHAVHGLFSEVKYPSIAGTATARDFVEFPSQFNEDWDINPEVIAHYAKHYQTGEPIPAKLLNKILKSHKFNQGHDTTEYLAAAILDMEWHSIAPGTRIDNVEEFEHKVLAKHGIDYAPVPPRYKTSYFSHSFGGGYSAGYYAYLWTEVLAADAFSYMDKTGGLTLKNGNKYRQAILSKGNSQDLMGDYMHFRGNKPTTDALLKRRGLKD